MVGPKFCAWMLLFSLIAIVVSGIFGLPPLPAVADISNQDVISAYTLNSHKVMVFGVVTCLSVAFFIPACCGLSVAMMRMQPRSLFLAIIQCVGGIFALIGPFLAGMVMTVAAVREGTSPSVILALNDFAVILIQLSTASAVFQGGSLAIAIWRDKSPDRILPGWFAWTSLIWSIIAQGGLLASFFKSGPLAPDGVIGIILPMLSLAVWMITAYVVLIRIPRVQWIEADEGHFGRPAFG